MTSAGREAVELAARAGLYSDPWQVFILDEALGERADGKWAAFEVVEIIPRQNGKNGTVEVRELAGLYLFGEELILHSAHEFKAARGAFRRIKPLVEGTHEFSKRVAKIHEAHGKEGIELLPTPTLITGSSAQRVTISRTPRLLFVARIGDSGRSFSADLVVFDEAFKLPEQVVGAMMPTMAARPNPQLWYLSSPVDQEKHEHGVVLARVRVRGRAGGDPSLAYFEWCADEERFFRSARDAKEVALDPLERAAANPGLGIRITAEHIEREYRSMSAKLFQVERLGIGDWPPIDDEGVEHVVDPKVWANSADAASSALDPVAFAVDATPNRQHAAIGSAGRRADGRLHGEVIEHRSGMGWVVKRLIELKERWTPCAVVLDPSGPAGSFLPALREAGIEPVLLGGREMAQACGAFYDLIIDDGFRHLDQPELNAALTGACKRDLGDAWAWNRKDSAVDISPLVAVTEAVHGFAVHGGDQDSLVLEGSLMA